MPLSSGVGQIVERAMFALGGGTWRYSPFAVSEKRLGNKDSMVTQLGIRAIAYCHYQHQQEACFAHF
jgi:hypothetical protein